MKILLVSDTHRHLGDFFTVLEKVSPVDCILHMGDVEGDEEVIEAVADCPVHFVRGNNDFASGLDRDKELILDGVRVFMTHGHRYGVSASLKYLEEEGRSRGAKVVLFGHTHRPVIEYRDDLVLMNPGSLSYPRQQGRKPSFGILEIDRKKELHFTIKYLE